MKRQLFILIAICSGVALTLGSAGGARLVECYWPGVSEEKLAVAAQRARAAASELRRDRRELRFLGSILVPADATVSCLFDGLEADVRAVSEQAGVPFERVLESLLIPASNGKRRRNESAQT